MKKTDAEKVIGIVAYTLDQQVARSQRRRPFGAELHELNATGQWEPRHPMDSLRDCEQFLGAPYLDRAIADVTSGVRGARLQRWTHQDGSLRYATPPVNYGTYDNSYGNDDEEN